MSGDHPLLAMVVLSLIAANPAGAQPVTRTPTLAPPVAEARSAADADARRAAAGRLLVASRFRERQVVLLKDALRAAEAEMADECLNRATGGQSMKVCNAVAAPSPSLKARLAASESAMLDEIMAASQTIYARHFTVAEMDEITRFFRTSVGQRYGTMYPQILGEVQLRKRDIARRYLSAAATANRTR